MHSATSLPAESAAGICLKGTERSLRVARTRNSASGKSLETWTGYALHDDDDEGDDDNDDDDYDTE